MTIADKINTLATIRAGQAALLHAEGATVPDTWDEYTNAFAQIVGGGGGTDWFQQLDGFTDYSHMFNRAVWSNIESVPHFDTSNGTNFSFMFYNCSSLTTVPHFDTSSGRNFSRMFSGCSSLTTVPLFDTSSGTNFGNMFDNCGSIQEIGVYGFRYSIDVSGNQLSAAAINALFEQAGTAYGPTQSITVTGNPGAADCDPSIAEAKGWTVINTELTNDDLDVARLAIFTEQEHLENLERISEQITALAEMFRAGGGAEDKLIEAISDQPTV